MESAVTIDSPRGDDAMMKEEKDNERVLTPDAVTIWNLTIRSPKLPNGHVSVPTTPESELANVVEFVNEVLGEATAVELEFAKVIYKGKLLQLHKSVKEQLKDGDVVLLLFTSRKEIDALRASEKVDNRIRSIEEEDEIHRKRLERSSPAANSFWGEDQDPKYKFVKIEICSRFKTPHPFEAEKLLIKLATDPGIKKIMRKYQWTVGTLAEMDPKSDMIARRKQDEEGACVLGYNENMGHKIFLRLRTDDELEFRGYDGLINTLIHELTHNVRGPHDEEFWRVFGQLKSEYLKFHETEYRQGNSKARRVVNTETKVSNEIRGQAGNSALSASERHAAASVVSTQNPRYETPKPYIPTRLGAANSRARQEERERLAKAAEARLAAPTSLPVPKPDCCGHDHSGDEHFRKASDSMTLPRSSSAVPRHSGDSFESPKKNADDDETKMVIEEDDSISEQPNLASNPDVPMTSNDEPVKRFFVEPSPFGYDEGNTSDREKRIRQAVIQLCRSPNGEATAGLVHKLVANALTGDVKYKTVKTTGQRFSESMTAAGTMLLESVGFEQGNGVMTLTRDDPGLLILAKLLLEESRLVGDNK